MAKKMNVVEHLAWMQEQLVSGKPFYHVRYADGEAATMGLVEHGAANCDGHEYLDDLRVAMQGAFSRTCCGHDTLLGTLALTDPPHPASKALTALTPNHVDCTVAEFFFQEEVVEGWEEAKALFQAIRDRKAVLVCPRIVFPAARVLNAWEYEIPSVNAWKSGPPELPMLERGVYVWCAGMPGKVWSREMKDKLPESTHIDMGSTFDGICGRKSREWMKRDGVVSQFYFGEFAEYVRSFR